MTNRRGLIFRALVQKPIRQKPMEHRVRAVIMCGILLMSLTISLVRPMLIAALTANTTSNSTTKPITPSSDLAVQGWGDASGYHVAVGEGGSDNTWHQVTLIHPNSVDAASWTGYQCLTGDGKFAAVTVLPASAVNTPSMRQHGAFAYSVDLSSDAVHPIASGVAAIYDSPSCGIGDEAAFRISVGDNEQSTEILRADLSSGIVTQDVHMTGQITSVVPSSDGLVGVMGTYLVSVPAGSTDLVSPNHVVSVTGQAYDLRAASDGGIDLLTTTLTNSKATVWHEKNGHLTSLGFGSRTNVQLFGGRSGHSIVTGVDQLDTSTGTRQVRSSGLTSGTTGVSLDGGSVFGYAAQDSSLPTVVSTATGQATSPNVAGDTPKATTAIPSFTSKQVTSPVQRMTNLGATTNNSATNSLTIKPQTASAQTPICAVSRLDPHLQVLQPNAAQINWAVQMAEQNLLTSSMYQRPANYADMGLAPYSPNSDFPAVALSHPSSDSWNTVPRSVMEAIMAQESNWDQASWHALPGIAGDPLVADYYGNGANSIDSINYAGADCGYGISQVTTGMHVDDSQYSTHGQMKIAVDYEENISAGLNILQNTWNQLYSDNIIANNGSPRYLENWYFAAWAYNTGIQPTRSFNTTGCTPGPSCTGPDGTWGLGWLNNPANPDYPPNRAAYLQTTYADAAHPSSWPYQERIMGWMGSPLLSFGKAAYATPTYNGGSNWLQIAPLAIACSTSGNDCTPPTQAGQSGTCGLSDSECWWHQPASWITNCTTNCATSAYDVGGGSTQPSVTNPHPPTCSLDSNDLPTTSNGAPIIVDDLASTGPLNVVGCSQSPNWSNHGSFNYTYGTNSSGDPIGAIDTHQLGAGFGGHILFTHTETGAQPELINKGTWTPTLPKTQYYEVGVHLPATGAGATDVTYTVNPGGGVATQQVHLNQAIGDEAWVSLGSFSLSPGASVTLSNQSNATPGTDDVAFDALAFLPEGGTPGVPVGGPLTAGQLPAGSDPSWPGCLCSFNTAGDPVNTSTGYYSDSWSDLATAGRGMPLKFSRNYASALADPSGPNGGHAVNGPFGYGWTFSYGLQAVTNADSSVTVHQEDGSIVTFTLSGSTYTVTTPRDDVTLTKSGSTYTFTRRGQQVFGFDITTGHLLSESTLAGLHASTPYQTSLAYNGSGQLSTITDPSGQVYTLTWIGSHITQLNDSSGRTITYAYDTNGNLTDVYGVGTTRTPTLQSNDRMQYTYTPAHLMASVRSPKNFGSTATPTPVTSMTYDSNERVTTQTDPLGKQTHLAYGPSASPSLAAGQTLITSTVGNQTLDTYQNGLLVSQTRGYGTSLAGTWSYTYDPVSLGVTLVTDPNGHAIGATYDLRGNQLTRSTADGNTTAYTYNNANQITTSTDPTGLLTTYGYDQTGHVHTSATTTNATGTYTWGDLTSKVVTPLGQSADGGSNGASLSASYYYDDSTHPGDRTRATDPLGHTMTYAYDGAGNATTTTDPLGNITKSSYDVATGHMTASVTANGVAAGTTLSCTPLQTGCTTYAYDAFGNLVKKTDPLGHISQATWDADGNQLTTTDPDNHTTTYAYDAAGQKVKTTQPDNTTLTSAYNADGSVASNTDAGGHKTSYSYNSLGLSSSSTDPKSRVTTYNYDLAGNAIHVVKPDGLLTTTTFDAMNRPTAIQYSDGVTPNITGITYDANGRRTSMTDGTGTSSWSYDVYGNMTASQNGAGLSTAYAYDADGNQTSITYPGNRVVKRTFNAANQVSAITDWNGKATSFAYTHDGQLATTTNPNGTVETTRYDNADHPSNISLTAGSTSVANMSYQRDNAGEITTAANTVGAPTVTHNYTYSPLLQVKTDVTGTANQTFSYNAANEPTTLANTTQTYDSANQLCWSVSPAATGTPSCATAPTGATTYTYNSDGRRTQTKPATGTASTYAYNQAGELTSATTPGGTTTYKYNGLGLRMSKTSGNTSTHFMYDTSNGDHKLLYDGATDYIYGPDGQPLEQVTGGTTTYWYLHDQQGSTVALINNSGAIAGTYTYNTYGQTTAHTSTAKTPLQYTGEYADAETGFVYLRARYYDPATAQFITVDPALAQTGSAYGYVGNNPLNGLDPFGLDWYNPTSWSSDTWINVGVVTLSVVEIVATGGLDTPAVIAQDTAIEGTVNAVTDVAASRVALRVGTKRAIQEATPTTEDGKFYITHTGTKVPVEGPFDYGHVPGQEWWRTRDLARSENWTRERLIEEENNPAKYRIEERGENRSHCHEMPR